MKREHLIALGVGVFILVLVNLPILYFYLFPKENFAFLGRRVINSLDMYTYISFIEESKQGKFILSNLYTTQPQQPSLVRPSYLVLGKIAAILNMSSIAVFHIGRLLLSIAFLIVLYKFLSKFFDSSEKKLVAFILTLTSSGFGIALGRIVPNASDLWIPEANTFLTLAEPPHFLLSQALIVGGLMLFISFLTNKKLFHFLLSALCFLLLAFEHPYDLFIVGPIVFLTTLWVLGVKPINLVKGASYAAVLTFGILFQFWQAFTNPILKSWQVEQLSPSPINYLIGFGLLLPLAIVGAEKFLKEMEPKYKLILVWIFVSSVLIYAPVSFQRRMIEGIHLPLAILAATGLFFIAEIYKKWAYYIIAGGLIVLSLTSFFVIFNDFKTIGAESFGRGYYYHISKSEAQAILWMKDNSGPEEAILANYFYGNFIPGITGRKVFLGHEAQSGDFERKVESINAFLLSTDAEESVRFLKASKIRYIFLGVNDTMISYGFKPDKLPYLKKVYSKEGVEVFEVL